MFFFLLNPAAPLGRQSIVSAWETCPALGVSHQLAVVDPCLRYSTQLCFHSFISAIKQSGPQVAVDTDVARICFQSSSETNQPLNTRCKVREPHFWREVGGEYKRVHCDSCTILGPKTNGPPLQLGKRWGLSKKFLSSGKP